MQTFLTNLQASDFLSDFAKRSETIILEEGKEKKELEAICEARHYSIKNSRDLAVFKTIYAFTDRPNANGAILPKQELLRVLPQLIGKPISVDHNRNHVVGHYIDYRYKAKENTIIAYGVFYKSNFADLWEEAQELFKKNKLGTSFEIWSPADKRVHRKDGTYELHEMEIAGGALLFGEKPAFDEAKVLEMAKKQIEFPQELVRAMEEFKKYKEDELIKPTNIMMTPKQIICSNCGEKIIYNGIDIKVQCPKCKSILNSEGVMQFPPQIKDFQLLCPSCKLNNWLIISRDKDKAIIKCLGCSKDFNIDFSIIEKNKLLEKINFYYLGVAMCPQCKKEHLIEAISTINSKTIRCDKCGLEFVYNLNKLNDIKKISKIEEIKNEVKIQENTVKVAKSEEGGKEKMFIVELSKFHRYIDVENFDEIEKASIEEEYDNEVIIDQFDIEIESYDDDLESEDELEEARLTYEERQNLPDDMFAVIIKVKNEKTGELRKIRKYPINDEIHVRNALARLGQPKAQATLRKYGISIKSIKARILKRARELKMTELLKRHEAIKLTYEERKELSDDMFAVVIRVKNKKTGEIRKIRKYPIHDEAHVRNALARLAQSKPRAELRSLGISPEIVLKKILKRAKELNMTDILERHKEKTEKVSASIEQVSALENAVKQITDLKKELENEKIKVISVQKDLEKANEDLIKIKSETEKKIELLKVKAKEVVKREKELGDLAKGMTDEEILNDELFIKAKVKKENSDLEQCDVIGDKSTIKDSEYYKGLRKEIDSFAFDTKKKKK